MQAKRTPTSRWVVAALALGVGAGAGMLAGTQARSTASGQLRAVSSAARLSPAAEIGRQLFYDPSLSASGRMSCASCHEPAAHYAPDNDRAVQMGGAKLDQFGFRAVPGLTYIDQTPAFDLQTANPDGTASGPAGGLDWDGREPDVASQSGVPLLASYEMANPSREAVVARLRARPALVARFQAAFGPAVFNDTASAWQALGQALQAYQFEDSSFHPYTSKYDYYNRGLATLTPQELRGMRLFNDADRANCSGCHTAGQAPGRIDGLASGQFTDFFFRNIGVPDAPASAKAPTGLVDRGLCGPVRGDLAPSLAPGNARYCGMFSTPSLRNAATRHVFFHNGSFRSLRDVVEFYVTRDTDPARWYRDGKTPDNADRDDMPFAVQRKGGKPVLTEPEIDDLVAFLGTLTDGYQPPGRAALALGRTAAEPANRP